MANNWWWYLIFVILCNYIDTVCYIDMTYYDDIFWWYDIKYLLLYNAYSVQLFYDTVIKCNDMILLLFL